MTRSTLMLALVVLAANGCGGRNAATAPPALPHRVAMSSGDVTVGKVRFTGGSTFLVEGKAGAGFAVHPLSKSDSERTFAYFVIFKHDWKRQGGTSEVSPVLQSDNKEALSALKLRVDDRKFELLEKFLINPQDGTLGNESLTVDGNPIEPEKGRLFLVDMTASPVQVKQKDIPLPAEVAIGALNDEVVVEAVAKKMLSKLADQDPEVKKFIASAGGVPTP